MIEEGTAVDGWLDAAPAAIQKAHPERLLEAGDGRRHDRLRDGEMVCRLRHAAPLHHREQDMQVAQFEAPADPIGPLHICHS